MQKQRRMPADTRSNAAAGMRGRMEQETILSVRDLVVKFSLRGQELTALRGVSLDIKKGESLAIVGESGSGKSVLTKTFIGMLDNNGWVDSGSIVYNGEDIAAYKTNKEWIRIRGKEIAIVFQDPMTSLNPLKTIGKQIQEALEIHQGMKGKTARPSLSGKDRHRISLYRKITAPIPDLQKCRLD